MRHMKQGKLLVGLCGNKGCGKDTIADVLCKTSGYVKIAFADGVYEAVSAKTGVAIETLKRRETKEMTGWELLVPFNSAVTKAGLTWRERVDLARKLKGKSPRQYLQEVGEEFKATDPMRWVKIVEKKISDLRAAGQKKIVVTDIRFEFEHKALKRLGAGVFRITRIEADEAARERNDNHVSEQWLREVARKDPSIRVIANNHLPLMAAIDIKRQLFHC